MASENAKSKFIIVRVTEKEKKQLAIEADELSLTISMLTRKRLGLTYDQGYKV